MNKGFRIEKRRIGKAVVYMVLILLALYTLFPLLILVINSFKPHTDIIANPLACYHVWRIRNEYVDFPLSWIYEKCSGIIGGGSCIGWRRCYSDIFKGGISPG